MKPAPRGAYLCEERKVNRLTEVVRILSNARTFDVEEDEHSKVIELVLSDLYSPVTHVSAILELAKAYGPAPMKNDKYWASVLEAVLLMRYERAHQYVGELRTELCGGRATVAIAMYPPVLIALLRAGATSEQANEQLEGQLAGQVGAMLAEFADGAHERKECKPSEWAVRAFSEALSKYLGSHFVSVAERRIVNLSRATQGITHVSENVAPFFRELTGRYHQLLSIGEHLQLLGPALAAKAKVVGGKTVTPRSGFTLRPTT